LPEPQNAHCFSEPHWLVIARGFDVERWFEDGQVVGTGGIANPQEVHLRIGQRHYRFANSTSSQDSQVGGGWWIEHESFKTIEKFAREHGYSLSEAARLFLALPYDWTRVDRLVSAILEAPLKAYAGLGKPAMGGGAPTRDRNTTWTPMQHQRVQQLYIPGLFVRGARPREQLYARAFPKPEFEFIVSNRRRV
jgi:hypothetical protein